MSELHKLVLDGGGQSDDDRPPWEESAQDDGYWCSLLADESVPPTGGSALGSYAKGKQPVKLEEREADTSLEIYKKAEHFNRLKLISGNSIGVPVKDYILKHYGKEGLTRYTLAAHLMKVMNFIPSDDVLLMLSCTRRARVVIATAGAGKTTSLQLDLAVSKMMDTILHNYHLDPVVVEGTEVALPCILYLNYNRHNVGPITKRHNEVCARVNASIKEKIDNSLESSTVHAFCHKWLTAFAEDLGHLELKIATDDEREKLWTAVMTPRWKKFYEDSECTVEWQTLDELYVFKVESMLDWDVFFQTAKFVDTGLKSDFVKSCIKKYDALKKAMKLMDFTDYLLLMIDCFEQHPELKELIQDRYKIIVADENQDFTALMNELLLHLYNPKKNQLIVVGDPDQTIYQFKGVSPDNVVNLVDRLEDCEILGIDTNYRCPDGIVEAAKRVLDMNILRFKKPIKTVKTGGVIVKHPIKNMSMQYREMLDIISANGISSYKDTVIAYRNNRSSIILGEELYYANIPFRVLDTRRPFNNIAFKHIQQGLQALLEKDNTDLNRGLFHFLPLSREMWYSILDENAKRRNRHFHDLIIPRNVPSGTEQAISALVDISMRIETAPCSDYIGVLFNLYRKYYYDFLASTPNPAIGDTDIYMLLLERSQKFWGRSFTYDYMMQELRERNVDKPDAITLSTFHGLKGLEFDYVIAADFNDGLFPNFFGIEQRYPANTALEEKESENRLCYVLVTRTIKELHLLYSNSDPSVYVDILCPREVEGLDGSAGAQAKSLSLGGITMPSDTMSAKLSYIQRLTGGRKA